MPGPADIIAPPLGGLLIPGPPDIAEPAALSDGGDIAEGPGVAPPAGAAGAAEVPASVDDGSSLPPQPIRAAAQQMRTPEKWNRSIGRN